MFAVLDVLSENEKGVFSLSGGNGHDGVNDRFTEFDISVLFEAIRQEFEKDATLVRNSLIKKLSRLDNLNFEINPQVWKISSDLLDQFLNRVLVACLEES